jgi:uncharacterized membrane protein (UPF0127 family)
MMARRVIPLLVVGLALLLFAVTRGVAEQVSNGCDQPYAEAQVEGLPRLSLELAVKPEERQRGLMVRTELPPDSGMLFVFGEQGNGPFWNMNTLIPLSIAYIDRDGTIVDLQEMKAITPGETPTLYPPARPYWYALEANQGWYAAHGVGVGTLLSLCLPPTLQSAIPAPRS